MKNCEEMTNSLIERRDEYLAEQKKKRKNAAKIIAPVTSICLVALLGFGAWKLGILETSTWRGLLPSWGPTIPAASSWSITRPALA